MTQPVEQETEEMLARGMVALIHRQPTEEMMQAGLYQSPTDAEWADVYSMWTDMWDCAVNPTAAPVSPRVGLSKDHVALLLPKLVELHDEAWTDFDPFTQGCFEGVLTGGVEGVTCDHFLNNGRDRMAFSDLAPETVKRIIEDCAAYCSVAPFPRTRHTTNVRPDPNAGRRFWANRQERRFDGFPPLTVYLGDDGKVYLREIGQ